VQPRGVRIGLVVAAAAIAVALFVVLSGDDDDATESGAATTTQTEAQPADGGQESKPEIPTIEVKGGEPIGGVQELAFNSGDRIRFRVTSDAPAEVHLHGYNVMMDVEPGRPVTFDVPADIEGIFEVELEETAVQIAEVEVSPG
jgi:hypothetical protein